MVKTVEYNEINLEHFSKYPYIRTDNFWDSNINLAEQLITRYTKTNDNMLVLGTDLFDEFKNNSKRNIINIDELIKENNISSIFTSKKKMNIQFILARTDYISDDRFNPDFGNQLKALSNILDKNRFFVLIATDLYYDSELHLCGFQYADILVKQGLRLKSTIVRNIYRNYSNCTNNLWKYRALISGLSQLSYEYIFIFQKV